MLEELVLAMRAVTPLADLPGAEDRRGWRSGAGISRETAAALCGVAVRSLADWERGLRTPTMAHRRVYLRFLAVARSLATEAA